MANSITRSLAANWLGLGLNMVVSFFLAPFVVNQLGSVYYGIWAVTLQFTGYLHLLDFGTREAVIRYVSKYVPRRRSVSLNRVLSAAVLVYLPVVGTCLLLTAGAAWGVGYWFNVSPEDVHAARWTTWFVGMTIAQTFVFNVFTGVLHGLQRFDVPNVIGSMLGLVRAALVVAVLGAGYGVVALSVVQFVTACAAGFVSMLVAFRLLARLDMPFRPRVPPLRKFVAYARNVLGFGKYVLINNVAQKVIFASDAVLVAILMPISAVTHYAIAGKLIEYLRNLTILTAQVFNPLASKFATNNERESLGPLLVSGGKLALLIALPIAGTYALLGDQFIRLWMGQRFVAEASVVLLALAITHALSAPHQIMTSILYGMNGHRVLVVPRVGEALANLTLSVLLGLRWGLLGVALGTLISHLFITLIVLPRLVCPKVGLPLRDYFSAIFTRPLLAFVPFAAIAEALDKFMYFPNLWAFFGAVVLLVAIYVPSVYALALTPRERKRILTKVPAPVRRAFGAA